MGIEREIVLKRKVITYSEERINLFQFLKEEMCEMYLSHENQAVEIRIPTRVDYYSHWFADIPFSAIEDLEWVREKLRTDKHTEVLERYIDDIIPNDTI